MILKTLRGKWDPQVESQVKILCCTDCFQEVVSICQKVEKNQKKIDRDSLTVMFQERLAENLALFKLYYILEVEKYIVFKSLGKTSPCQILDYILVTI